MTPQEFFWTCAKRQETCLLAAKAARSDPAMALERGEMGEVLMHWAALSGYAPVTETIDAAPETLNAKDASGRKPVDWAMEKMFFAKSEAKDAAALKIGQAQAALAERAMFALSQAGCELRHPKDGVPGGYGLMELALRAGSLVALEELMRRSERKSLLEETIWWACGAWDGEDARARALGLLWAAAGLEHEPTWLRVWEGLAAPWVQGLAPDQALESLMRLRPEESEFPDEFWKELSKGARPMENEKRAQELQEKINEGWSERGPLVN